MSSPGHTNELEARIILPSPSFKKQEQGAKRIANESKLVYNEVLPEVYADIFSNDDRIPVDPEFARHNESIRRETLKRI